MLTDNGSEFRNDVFDEVCDKLEESTRDEHIEVQQTEELVSYQASQW